MLTFNSLMMPLAFDLISTLEMGSTRPVATTERARSLRVTVAIFDGSISALARVIRVRPKPPSAAISTNAADTNIHLRDFFLAINNLIMLRISDDCVPPTHTALERIVFPLSRLITMDRVPHPRTGLRVTAPPRDRLAVQRYARARPHGCSHFAGRVIACWPLVS